MYVCGCVFIVYYTQLLCCELNPPMEWSGNKRGTAPFVRTCCAALLGKAVGQWR